MLSPLDEIVFEGARGCWPAPWRPRPSSTWPSTRRPGPAPGVRNPHGTCGGSRPPLGPLGALGNTRDSSNGDAESITSRSAGSAPMRATDTAPKRSIVTAQGMGGEDRLAWSLGPGGTVGHTARRYGSASACSHRHDVPGSEPVPPCSRVPIRPSDTNHTPTGMGGDLELVGQRVVGPGEAGGFVEGRPFGSVGGPEQPHHPADGVQDGPQGGATNPAAIRCSARLGVGAMTSAGPRLCVTEPTRTRPRSGGSGR
jgi:hypothetical protein